MLRPLVPVDWKVLLVVMLLARSFISQYLTENVELFAHKDRPAFLILWKLHHQIGVKHLQLLKQLVMAEIFIVG